MEKDDEISGGGNSYTAEFWEYDSRLGKRWNIDPIFKAWQSSYSTFANNPIFLIDPNGNSEWHPEDLGNGEQILVADKGDIDVATGKVDKQKFKDYLDQTVGVTNYTQEEFDNWIIESENTYSLNGSIENVFLYSESGQFENLIGKYLVNKSISDPDWGVTHYEGNNCSPTTFNRVDMASEFVYGKDILGKMGGSTYNAWQGNKTKGYGPQDLYGIGVSNKFGLGTIIDEVDIKLGTLKSGALLRLTQTPGVNGAPVSWHAAIFLNYLYNDQGEISGFLYWHHWTYSTGDLKGKYTGISIFNFDNEGKYVPHGYKGVIALNFD